MTPQRLAVMEYMFTTPGHSSVAQVFSAVSKTLRSLSLSTVYDTLEVLRREGVVELVWPVCKECYYQIADDSHFHLVCSKCNRVQDFPADALPRLVEHLSRLSRATGFTIERANILFLGLCPDCR